MPCGQLRTSDYGCFLIGFSYELSVTGAGNSPEALPSEISNNALFFEFSFNFPVFH